MSIPSIQELQSGEDRTLEVEPNDLRGAEILFTDQLDDLREADFHIVAVPTPINQAKSPNCFRSYEHRRRLEDAQARGHCGIRVYGLSGCTKTIAFRFWKVRADCALELILEWDIPLSDQPGDEEHSFTKIKGGLREFARSLRNCRRDLP